MQSFTELGLSTALVDKLTTLGFVNPTPIQEKAIPQLLENPDRDFIGRKVLEDQKEQGIKRKLVGLVLKDRGVLRSHQKVTTDNNGDGETTSGSFSPTLNSSIAFARIPADASKHCHVEIRNKQLLADIVKPPFVRFGKSCIDN